jgi:hypothetical protein
LKLFIILKKSEFFLKFLFVQLLLFFFLEGRYGSRAGGGTAGPEATNGAGGQGKRWEVGQCQLLCVVKKIESDGRNKGAEGGGAKKKETAQFWFLA